MASGTISGKGSFFMNFMSCVLIAVQPVLLAVFLLGMTNAFGDALTPISAFNLFMNFFSFTRAKSYECVFGALLALLYVVVIVIVLKNVVASATKLAGGKNKYDDEKVEAAMDIGDYAASTAKWILLFIIFSCGFTDSTFSLVSLLIMTGYYLILGVAKLSHLIAGGYGDFTAFPNVVYALKFAASGFAFLIGAWALSGRAFGYDFIDAFSMLFRGNIGFEGGFGNFIYSFYLNFLEPVLLVVIAVLFLRGNVKTVLSILAAMIVMQFVCRGILAFNLRHFSWDILLVWFEHIRTLILPLFFAELTIWWMDEGIKIG